MDERRREELAARLRAEGDRARDNIAASMEAIIYAEAAVSRARAVLGLSPLAPPRDIGIPPA